MKLSVVIPAYNEEGDIKSTLDDVMDYLRSTPDPYEVIVVDDGSGDKTAQTASGFKGVKVISYRPNRGKGYAVRTGVLQSSGDYILFMDADNSTRIIELDHMLPKIKQYDIVIGSRAIRGSRITVHQPLVKRVLGRAGNLCIRFMLGLPIHDTQCGFKLFRSSCRAFFSQQKLERWGFDFEVLFLAHKAGARILEEPITWTNNFDTKVSPLSYLSTLAELARIRIRYLLGKYA